MMRSQGHRYGGSDCGLELVGAELWGMGKGLTVHQGPVPGGVLLGDAGQYLPRYFFGLISAQWFSVL